MSGSPRVIRSGDEVVVSLAGARDFPALCRELERLLASDERVRRSPVLVLEVGDGTLSQDQLVQLEEAVSRRLGPRLLQVVSHDFGAGGPEAGSAPAAASPSAAADAREVARRAGPATAAGGGEGARRESGGLAAASSIEPGARPGHDPAASPERPVAAETGSRGVRARGAQRGGGVVVRRTLRSGHRLVYDGDVIIVGDVNPGAEVIASGDILVFGRLRGTAHAGARGDWRAIVASMGMEPVQVRIAGFIGRAPDRERRPAPRDSLEPEVAFVRDGRVIIEPFELARLHVRLWQRLPDAARTG
ncbi:MAG TPA: septum site-determining protein MinC [Thermaerobacter sp.]